ncbi:MAG TPA: TatD family hydrolase [Chitinophagaceae bacterium]|nr:TatD family hydrolase [Chitinophagaceae bacterium]
MTLIDTHSHIYLPEFDYDRERMLERAGEQAVSSILLPAIDSSTHEQMLNLGDKNPDNIHSMMGVHPCSVKGNYRNELEIALKYLEKRPFKAIGETGLDFYWDKTFSKEQYASFHEQIEWALNFNIPIVIHSRNSIDECIKVISEHQKGKLNGVFHCFSGSIAQGKMIIDLGFYMGIGGVITFKNSGLDKVMSHFTLDNLVLETDAPYLAPVPFRGKRNEPGYLKFVVEKLSFLKEIAEEEIARSTTANAKKLFGI